MSNTQLYLAIGIPSLLVLIGMLLNFSAIRNLRTELTGRAERTDNRLDSIDVAISRVNEHLIAFYGETGRLSGRLDELSKSS